MRLGVDKNIAQIQADRKRAERGIKRVAQLTARFERKNAGRNMMAEVLTARKRDLERDIAGFDKMLCERQRVLEILADYRFRSDAPVQYQRFVSLGGFGATTSTG